MKTSTDVVARLDEYHNNYRHPNLPRLSLSGIYSLFPSEPQSVEAQYKWPSPWPHGERPGVYFIFGPEMQLLYVGKTSCLGRRLSDYFMYSERRSGPCKVFHAWRIARPTYLATVPLEKSFEAPSLEEFLISTLQPPENKMGIVVVGEEQSNNSFKGDVAKATHP